MIMIYLIKTIIFLLFTSFITSSQQLESKLKLYINKVYEINPNSNITNCLSKYHDDSLHLVCKKSHSNQTFNCPNGHPNAKDVSTLYCSNIFLIDIYLIVITMCYFLHISSLPLMRMNKKLLFLFCFLFF